MSTPLACDLLQVPEKETIAMDLFAPLRCAIVEHYSECEAQLAEDDLATISTLRAALMTLSSGDLNARYDLLLSYFKALSTLESRLFPFPCVEFTWHDAFDPGKKAAISSIQFEMAAVLFNIGAVWSQIAVVGRQAAAFQKAAGVFGSLKEDMGWIGALATVDLSPECLGMLQTLMLAQAQECIAEQTAPGQGEFDAAVSRQVELYYEQVYDDLNSSTLNRHFVQSWFSHMLLKKSQFYADACYRYSMKLHEKKEIGEEIARLNLGIRSLVVTKELAIGDATPLLDAVFKLESNMNCKLESAVKENQVYLMQVPAASSLSSLPALSFVKPISMSLKSDPNKEGLFLYLVPKSSVLSMSKYTQMVNDIVRTQVEKIQQQSEKTRIKLKEMDLPSSIQAFERCLSLDLKNDVKSIQTSGGLSFLEMNLNYLKHMKSSSQKLLIEIKELLQKESRQDSALRVQFGTRWTRASSNPQTNGWQVELQTYAGILRAAGDKVTCIDQYLRSYRPIAFIDYKPIEDATVESIKKSLRQLEDLEAKRAGFEDSFKVMKKEDDLLRQLVVKTGHEEDTFKKRLLTYDDICNRIAKNIEAEGQLLLQIQEQKNEFADVFNVSDSKVSCAKLSRRIASVVAQYNGIKDSIEQSTSSYFRFAEELKNMKLKCDEFVRTRSIECQKMTEDLEREMADIKHSGGFTKKRRRSASGMTGHKDP